MAAQGVKRAAWEQVESRIDVRFLKKGYQLVRVYSGEPKLPLVASLRAAIADDRGQIVKVLERFSDLSAFVAGIRSTPEAVAYVRLYTVYPDFLMFDDRTLEVQPAGEHIALPRGIATRLLPPEVRQLRNGNYGIARNLVRPGSKQKWVIFRSAETVTEEGQYTIRIAKRYAVGSGEVRIGLPE